MSMDTVNMIIHRDMDRATDTGMDMDMYKDNRLRKCTIHVMKAARRLFDNGADISHIVRGMKVARWSAMLFNCYGPKATTNISSIPEYVNPL
jgi:hypothetical protein